MFLIQMTAIYLAALTDNSEESGESTLQGSKWEKILNGCFPPLIYWPSISIAPSLLESHGLNFSCFPLHLYSVVCFACGCLLGSTPPATLGWGFSHGELFADAETAFHLM